MDTFKVSFESKDKYNQIDTKCYLKNIKNKFILKYIINHLHKIKFLKIINSNKFYQNKLLITLNDFKECSENIPIEIEIIPINNKFGKFINFVSKNDKQYYRIYFNDSAIEIKKNYLTINDKINKIRILINNQIISFNNLFERCESIEKIYFKKFYRNNINNMYKMCSGCRYLKEINLSTFKTENVTNMSYMFHGCSSLKEINVSNFNTNNVNDISHIFSKCSSLEKIYLFNFNINNEINFDRMFYGCSSLMDINISSNFNFHLKNPDWVFGFCDKEIKKKIKTHILKINKI